MNLEAEIPDSLLPAPMRQVLEIAQGNAVLQALYVATKLGIADLLADGPKTYHELASASSVHPDGLYRLLRLLTRFQVFIESAPGCFALTPAAETLRDQPSSLRDFVLYSGEEFYQSWGHFLRTLYVAENAFQLTYGMNRCDYLARNPNKERLFDAGTQIGIDIYLPALVAAYDFSRVTTLVDIGKGDRLYLAAILHRYPNLRAIWIEKTALVATTQQRLADQGLAERCEVIAASPFAPPPAADGYLISNLQRLEDSEALQIMGNCRQAITAGGRLFLIERFITDRAPWTLLVEDLGLNVQTTGRIRTLNEIEVLLTIGGFRVIHLAMVDITRGVFEAEVS